MAKRCVLPGAAYSVSVALHFREPLDEWDWTNRYVSSERAREMGPLVSTSLGSSKCLHD